MKQRVYRGEGVPMGDGKTYLPDFQDRMTAAGKALPYEAPALKSVEVKGDGGGPVVILLKAYGFVREDGDGNDG